MNSIRGCYQYSSVSLSEALQKSVAQKDFSLEHCGEKNARRIFTQSALSATVARSDDRSSACNARGTPDLGPTKSRLPRIYPL